MNSDQLINFLKWNNLDIQKAFENWKLWVKWHNTYKPHEIKPQ